MPQLVFLGHSPAFSWTNVNIRCMTLSLFQIFAMAEENQTLFRLIPEKTALLLCDMQAIFNI